MWLKCIQVYQLCTKAELVEGAVTQKEIEMKVAEFREVKIKGGRNVANKVQSAKMSTNNVHRPRER
jgi:hypothetical protein